MRLLNIIKNAFTNNSSSNGVISIGSFKTTDNNSAFDYLYENSDIQSCVDKIATNLASNGLNFGKGTLAKRFEQQMFDLIGDFDLFKHDYTVAKSFANEVLIVPIKNVVGGIAQIRVYSRKHYKKKIEKGIIIGFEVKDELGTAHYLADDVFYRQYSRSKGNRLSGFGMIDSLMNDLWIDLQATIAVGQNYKHASILSKFFKVKEGGLGDEVTKVREMIASYYSGAHNAGKTLTTNVIEEIHNIPFESIQTALDRNMTTDKICSRFGVNKELLGYSVGAGSEAKLKEIFHNFQITTMSNWNLSFQQDLNDFFNKFEKLMDGSKYIKFEILNDNSVTTEEQDNVRKNYLGGVITHNEARILLGLEPYDGGDVYRTPSTNEQNLEKKI